MVEALIDTGLLSSIQFHDVIDRFWDGRGTVKAIMELELSQEFDSVDHKPLFLVFLYLC